MGRVLKFLLPTRQQSYDCYRLVKERNRHASPYLIEIVVHSRGIDYW